MPDPTDVVLNKILCQIRIKLAKWCNISVLESDDTKGTYADQTVPVRIKGNLEVTKKKKVHKWVCTVCGMKCASESKLLKHVESHNSSRQSKRARVSNRLAKQQNRRREFKCDKCDESFESEEMLTLHLCDQVEIKELSHKGEDQNIPGHNTIKSMQYDNNKQSTWNCTSCKHVFISEANLTEHRNLAHGTKVEHVEGADEDDDDDDDDDEEEGEQKLTCDKCGKTFTSTRALTNHLRKHRETDDSFQCEHCDKRFFAFSSLRRHTRTAHEQFFKCALCNNFFRGKKLLKQHMAQEHSDVPKIYKCYNCDQNFDTEKLYTEHKSNCRIKCDLCDKELKGKNGFKKHMIRVHGEAGMCSCTVCGQQFPSISSLKRHESTHNQGQPYQCAICGKTYKTDLILKFHMDEHTGQTFQCTICNKTYKTRQNLKSHMYTHKARTKTFQCDICGKSLTRSKTLKIHLQIHSDERKFQCKFCSRAFNTLSYLDRHVKCVHENIKRFECNICGKTFSYKHNQQDHMTIHTGERNIDCPKCGLKFSTKRSLASHMVNHIETENFHCDICGKAFKTKTYLKNHKANHLNERRFKCVVCAEGFNTSSALVHHRKSHEKLM